MVPVSAALSLFLILLCPTGLADELSTDIDWQGYERGALGSYPQITFRSSDASAPLVHVERWSPECDTDSFTFLSPRGERIRGNKALLLDHKGELVWHHRERGAVNTVQVQKYKGNDYITYWVGDDEYYGHGRGYYKMVDQTYTLAYTIAAGNDLDGDYHDFSITQNDTAIVTNYVKVPWDLTAFGRENGYIWDCRFQEINVETSRVLFEWLASDHFKFEDMQVSSWEEWTGTDDDPWDWLHMNGVEKDHHGNYLISARYSNAVSYIDGRTGEFIWHLGGKDTHFIDLTEGNATKFIDPHMARWTNKNSTTISLFDNVAFWTHETSHTHSRGVHVEINEKKGIAKMVADFIHPSGLFAEEEGSMQLLDGGNFFIGYGSKAAYSEFSANGTLLCNTHYAPLHVEGENLEAGHIQTYRTYKQKWMGHPKEAPDVNIEHNKFHVSWNGATEVRSWRLDGRGAFGKKANSWTPIGTFGKTGFETSMGLSGAAASAYRLTALDGEDTPIRAWNVHPEGDVSELFRDTPDSNSHPSSFSVSFLALVLFAGLMLFLNRRYLPGM